MGMRRRTRRRAVLAGAAIAHHEDRLNEEAAYQEPAPAPAQYAPPPADPTEQVEHLVQLHDSGALTDEEFAAAKAKALGI